MLLNRFLIIDEADSLLGDRRYAMRSWEISQVNEMLTWMETHPLPFACTTNLKERLDQASLRRFTFKCCFDHLKLEQVGMAFRHFFGLDLPFLGRKELCSLTSGDFAVVRKKAEMLDQLHDPQALVGLLQEEAAIKTETRTKRIGF
jgi:SpoVK/Ycf46/Vps4 family AAA+-type ATPase